MAKIIFVVIFLIFTNIFADNPECEKESFCECSENKNNTHDYYISNKGVKFGINVKKWSDVEIECENISWKDVNLTREQKSYRVDSVEFLECPLPEETSLKDIVTKLGIIEINRLSFRSHIKIRKSLTKEHFQGLPSVTELDLCFYTYTNISYDFFRNFPNLRSLELPENYLVLSNNTFNETLNLEKLDLQRNLIKELPFDIFHDLQNLRTLNLRGNFLTKLHEKLFEKLTSLKDLDLSNNYLLDLQPTIFYNLKELETINLSTNKFISLPLKLFKKNQKLKKVSYDNNKELPTTLPVDFLTDLENLQEIELRNNGFSSLPEKLFWGSTSLKFIDLTWNSLKELPKLIFFDLVHIEEIWLSNNLIEMLPDAIFTNLKSLKVLDLSYNRIVRVQRMLFHGLKSLRELNMEGNGLTYIHREAFSTNEQLFSARFSSNLLTLGYENGEYSPFYNNHGLRELYLSSNLLKHFYSDWTVNKIELVFLDLRYNNIKVLSANNFVFTSDNLFVDLRYNSIKNILLTNIEMLAIYNTEKRDVYVLVEYNPILCNCLLYDLVRYYNGDMPITVYNFIQLRLGNLKCVNPNGIQGPQINQLDFKTYQCPENEFFQIEEKCQTMCTCTIRPYDRMRVLDCSYNSISVFKIDKNNIYLEGSYPLTLNLTGNNLKLIPQFDDLESINLKHLLLSNNKISEISLDRLPKTIEVLELHNNNLSSISPRVSEFLLNHIYKKLTLSGNPFICDCNARYLYALVLKMQDTYTDLKNVKCKDQNIPLVDMTVKQVCPSNEPPEKIIKTME